VGSGSLESCSSLLLDSDLHTGTQTQTGAGTLGRDFDSSTTFSPGHGYDDLQRDRDVAIENPRRR
jgi:hypothetical protein